MCGYGVVGPLEAQATAHSPDAPRSGQLLLGREEQEEAAGADVEVTVDPEKDLQRFATPDVVNLRLGRRQRNRDSGFHLDTNGQGIRRLGERQNDHNDKHNETQSVSSKP